MSGRSGSSSIFSSRSVETETTPRKQGLFLGDNVQHKRYPVLHLSPRYCAFYSLRFFGLCSLTFNHLFWEVIIVINFNQSHWNGVEMICNIFLIQTVKSQNPGLVNVHTLVHLNPHQDANVSVFTWSQSSKAWIVPQKFCWLRTRREFTHLK